MRELPATRFGIGSLLAPPCGLFYRARIAHEDYLRHAIDLGIRTMRANRGGPFGAVVVRRGVIVGEGANAVLALHDPTAHAEMIAIREAAARLGTHSLSGCTLYASSEPCPMCLVASYWARVDAVVYASGRADAGRAGFDDAFFYDEIARPPAARRVPTQQVMVPEALALLDEWRDKPDKVPY